MKARLLIGCTEEDRLCVLLGVENGGSIELEALGDLVVELDLVAKRVGGVPRLGDGQAVRLVGVLGLEVTKDVRRFRVTVSVDLEGDVRGGRGFNLERGTVEVVVLAEEVIGGLAKVLYMYMHGLHQQGEKSNKKKSSSITPKNGRDEPSRMGERVAAETLWSDERVERRGSLCVGSGGEEIYKRVGLLAVSPWEHSRAPSGQIVRVRAGDLARMARMSVRYISRGVCQSTVSFYTSESNFFFFAGSFQDHQKRQTS